MSHKDAPDRSIYIFILMLTNISNYLLIILKEREHMSAKLELFSGPYNKAKGDKYYFSNEVIT